jgi:hypothetical protein
MMPVITAIKQPIIQIYFQAIVNKLEMSATSDGSESFSALLKTLPRAIFDIQGRTRKVELMRALAALEDFTACRFQDLVNDLGKKPPTASLKLLQELFTRCESRLMQHLDHIASDDYLSAIIAISIGANKTKTKRSADVAASAASKRKASAKGGATAGEKKGKGANGEAIKGCLPDGGEADDDAVDENGAILPRKPVFRPTNIVYDDDENVEVLSHARLTTKGGWRVQRSSVETIIGSLTKIYFQKDRPYKDRSEKDRFYKVAFNQVHCMKQ